MGDGNQPRSFMYIDDCVKGTQMILDSDVVESLDVGSSKLVSINQVVAIAEEVGGRNVKRNDNLTRREA